MSRGVASTETERIAERSRSGFRFRLIAVLLASCPLGFGFGCRGINNPSRGMVPTFYRGNPWGLDANHQRSAGRFPAIESTPKIAAWDTWGRANLKSGDVLFRMGDARAALGLFHFSFLTADMSASVFSHTGILVEEGNEQVVYDISSRGPSRQPFSIWMLDVAGAFGVKRPKPEYQGYTAAAVKFCQTTYQTQTPYDLAMKPGQEELYCVEMTEFAYRTAGLPLSEPIPIGRLPRFKEHERLATAVEMVSGIKRTFPVFMPGSDDLGIWSSPVLTPIYYAPSAERPVANGLALRPYGPGYR